MNFGLDTPPALFPAISLLLLAYTNRFLVTAGRVRELAAKYRADPDAEILGQISNLHERVMLVRGMQKFGVGSLALCVCSMLAEIAGGQRIAQNIFMAGLVLLFISLAIAFREIQISVGALDLELRGVSPAKAEANATV